MRVHSLAQFLKTRRQVSLTVLHKADEEDVHRVRRISGRSTGVGTNESTASDARRGHSCGSHGDPTHVCRRAQHPTWPPHLLHVTVAVRAQVGVVGPRGVGRSSVLACLSEQGSFIIITDAVFECATVTARRAAACSDCWGWNAQGVEHDGIGNQFCELRRTRSVVTTRVKVRSLSGQCTLQI